ncbi:glycosyltransferase family 29 protein [Aestuariivirga sp.]|uniref:glycosyltransferase family 29 protein n=1 Tax=Aestuariivirga sp. TaxID=2650926 RepID=UPI003918DB3F
MSLRSRLSGSTVALVGNARSLAASSLGAEIDRCSLVIRLNAAPQAAAQSHGQATHWLGVSSFVAARRLGELKPEMLLWMTPERRWRAAAAYGWRLPMLFYPQDWWRSLAAELGGARPTTGLMMIDLLRRLGGFAELRLFGFDFFQSGSLSARGLAAPPPHDFDREREHVLGLAASDPRIRLVGPAPAEAA